MAKLTKQNKNEIEVGEKFGKLTVQSFAESYNERLAICRCDCGQIVPATGTSLQSGDKQQCLNCDERHLAKNFQLNDVVIVKRSHYGFLLND